jgi:hypothetical protein
MPTHAAYLQCMAFSQLSCHQISIPTTLSDIPPTTHIGSWQGTVIEQINNALEIWVRVLFSTNN